MAWIIPILIFILAYFGVLGFRKWGGKRQFLDIPNERSSHDAPVVRGGGVVIVLACLGFYLIYSIFNPEFFSISYAMGAAAIALVSWLDDLRSVSFGWRFLVHSAAAVFVILELGYWQQITFSETIDLGFFGSFLTFIWIVWLINAYNFMDGIDGIAGLQAATAAIGWLIMGYLWDLSGLFYFNLAVLGAAAGFLLHNWQPAKVFMGDVGSAFLGFTFAVMPLLAAKEIGPARQEITSILPITAVLFVWYFVFDSILTFFRRLFFAQKVWRAHREHLYQRLVISGLSHQAVTLFYGVLSTCVVTSVIVGITLDLVYVPFLATAAFTIILLIFTIRRRKVLT